MTIDLKPDLDEAVAFLRQWHEDRDVVLSAKLVDEDTGKPGRFDTRMFKHPVDWDLVREWIRVRQMPGNWANVYFAVNPPKGTVDKKMERADVGAMVALHVDCDVAPGEDQAEEIKNIVSRLQHYKIPPSAIVISGGGAQGYWLLDEPVPVNGNIQVAESLKDYNRQVERDLQGDHCHDLSRIMRVPHTVNLPDEKKRAKGRVPALATLVEFSGVRYPLSTFEKAPPQVVDAEPEGGFTPSGKYEPVGPDDQHLKRLDEKLLALGICGDVEGRYVTAGKPDRSRAAIAFAKACVLAVVPDRVIAQCLMDPSWRIGECIRDKGSSTQRNLRRTIMRAHEFADSDKLGEMNEEHHVVNLGGKTLVLSWDWKDEVYPGLPIATYRTAAEFCKFYDKWTHRYTDGAGKVRDVPLGTWWWHSSGRRQYDGLVYAPHVNEDVVGGKLNLWRGFTVQPAQGDCSLYLAHLRDNVCVDQTGKPNQEYYDYLIGWMAYAVQHPERQGQVALVMLGKKGIGKTVAAEEFGKLFGMHYTAIVNSDHLTGKFNAHLQACSVLLADECFFAGDRRHEQILKTLVTGDRLFIEPKGVNGYQVKNYLHIILCTNSEWAVPASHDERRYFVLWVGEGHIQDIAYFKAICDQMENGGRSALLHMLLNLDLSKHTVGGKLFEVRRAPKTDALRDQQERSRQGVDALVEEMLVDGRVLFSHDSKPHVCITSGKEAGKGFDHYIESQSPSDLRRLGALRVKNALKKNWGCKHFHNRIASKHVAGIEFPPLADMRAAFEARHGKVDWPAANDWEASGEQLPF
jgi:hypothetical protein